MSTRKRQLREKFFREHPICCFCGGGKPSVEQDHVPGRVFFRDRQWPEGYVFPACVACNRITRHDEQAIAMLSRIYPDAPTQKEQDATRKLMLEVYKNHPELYREMQPSVRQYRDARKKYGLEPPVGEPITAIPVLSVAGPRIHKAVEQFSRKLFCALFYKHTGSVLGATGCIAMRWYTNIQIDANEIDQTVAKITPYLPKFERATMELSDQFFYRWGVTDTKRMGAFLAFFRESFAVLGIVTQDAKPLSPINKGVVLHPFSHPATPENNI